MPPTGASKVIAKAVSTRPPTPEADPSTALEKVMSPTVPPVLNSTDVESVTALLKLMLLSNVVILPPRLTEPVPV